MLIFEEKEEFGKDRRGWEGKELPKK